MYLYGSNGCMQVFKSRSLELPSALKSKTVAAVLWMFVFLVVSLETSELAVQFILTLAVIYSMGLALNFFPSFNGAHQLEVSDTFLKYRNGDALIWQVPIDQVTNLRRESAPDMQTGQEYIIYVYCNGEAEYSILEHNFTQQDITGINEAIKKHRIH